MSSLLIGLARKRKVDLKLACVSVKEDFDGDMCVESSLNSG